MNQEIINYTIMCVGFAASVAIALCVLLVGYLTAYELAKEAGKKLFFPLWAWELLCLSARVKLTRKPVSKHIYVQLFLGVLEDHEAKHPELRGVVRECCEAALVAPKDL